MTLTAVLKAVVILLALTIIWVVALLIRSNESPTQAVSLAGDRYQISELEARNKLLEARLQMCERRKR